MTTETKTLGETMAEAGFVPAADAARACGFAHVGSVHRMVKRGDVHGRQVGIHWYVSAASLLHVWDKSPLEAQVRAVLKELGVTPQPNTDPDFLDELQAAEKAKPKKKKAANGAGRRR